MSRKNKHKITQKLAQFCTKMSLLSHKVMRNNAQKKKKLKEIKDELNCN